MTGSTPAWESFAQPDAQYYIDLTLRRGSASTASGPPAGRWWSGRWSGPGELPHRHRAVEIGCGVGRNTVHLARRFERVDGVDVSRTMVQQARAQGVPENVHLHVLTGSELSPLPDASCALAFSHLVFQHIESSHDVGGYLQELGRVLSPGGIAAIQVDTRSLPLPVRAARALPDRVLPRARRRGIRRHPLDTRLVHRLGAEAGLELQAELGAGTADHWLRWRRP